MHTDKYIELLRFYVTNKIDESALSAKISFRKEIANIISSLLSVIFSLFLSDEIITKEGFWWSAFRIILIIIFYLVLYCIIKKIYTYIAIDRSIRRENKKKLPLEEKKFFIDQFDHIACDGILLAKDFYKKYSETETPTDERLFYLFESFYYYKKALNIVDLIVSYPEECVNNLKLNNGVAKYRLINVFQSLNSLRTNIKNAIDSETIDEKDELLNELNNSNVSFNKIEDFLTPKPSKVSK